MDRLAGPVIVDLIYRMKEDRDEKAQATEREDKTNDVQQCQANTWKLKGNRRDALHHGRSRWTYSSINKEKVPGHII